MLTAFLDAERYEYLTVMKTKHKAQHAQHRKRDPNWEKQQQKERHPSILQKNKTIFYLPSFIFLLLHFSCNFFIPHNNPPNGLNQTPQFHLSSFQMSPPKNLAQISDPNQTRTRSHRQRKQFLRYSNRKHDALMYSNRTRDTHWYTQAFQI